MTLIKLKSHVDGDHARALRVASDLAGRANSPQVETELDFALAQLDLQDHRRSMLSKVSDIREPDVYRRHGNDSFFADLVAASGFPVHRLTAPAAQERLQRHATFEAGRVNLKGKMAARTLGLHGIEARGEQDGAQSRALSTAAGAGGEMVPPAWIVEQWASTARAAAPLRGLLTRVDLPPDTLELHIPRFVSSAGVVPMQTENVNAPDQYGSTDATVSKVATFAGDVLLSQQEFDRGGHFADEIVLQDFAEAYGLALQGQLTSGSGLNGQLLGLLNVPTATINEVPGARMVTYTDAAPTPAKIIQAIAQCAGQISDTRDRSPSVVLMRGARWFALAGSPNGAANEPVQHLGTGVIPPDTDTGPYGPVAGLPVYHDNTLPTNVAGANQDVIVLLRARDTLLLEDPAGPRFTAYPTSTNAGALAVVLGWHHYVASIPHRYPSAVGTVQGTGLALPTGF